MMLPPVSRRGFLQSIGAGAVSMWIPGPVAGHPRAEMRAEADAGTLGAGLSKWELDTIGERVSMTKTG